MTEVIFGRGSRYQLSDAFGEGARVLVITTPGRGAALDEAVAAGTWWSEVARYVEADQHVPRAHVDAVHELAASSGATGVLAWGGGSVVGVAKALAVRLDMRKVYVPTTYSGSEMTNIWAVSDAAGKVTARDESVRADLVVYDADLLDSMPRSLVFVSLFNAMAHAVEALYAPNLTESVRDDALRAIELLVGALKVLAVTDDGAAREDALRGAMLAGRTLDAAQMGIHHKLAHVLGGTLGLAHAPVHTVMLPYSVHYNRDWARAAMADLSATLGGDPVEELRALQRATGVPMSLKELGADQGELYRVVDALFERPYPNPRPLDRDALARLVDAAHDGVVPEEGK